MGRDPPVGNKCCSVLCNLKCRGHPSAILCVCVCVCVCVYLFWLYEIISIISTAPVSLLTNRGISSLMCVAYAWDGPRRSHSCFELTFRDTKKKGTTYAQ